MSFIASLEKRLGSWAIPNLTIYLLVIQLVGVALLMGGYANTQDLVLVGGLVEVGQWSRLLSFLMIPKTLSPIWLFFAFYIFYLMGTALEREWGAFRYNLFILCGYLLTLAAAFIAPSAEITCYYFFGCVFLAFATLFPNIEFRLFFILPVKVKWLGWLTAGLYILTLLSADVGSRLCVVAAFANYLLFFGRNFLNNFKSGQRRKAFVAERKVAATETLHACAECGVTDKTDETMHFRYCSTCGKCFCEAHMASHSH
ncbi:MAG: hypothetical protein K9M54_08020 [Kiritimatiellales bacterium]|nr:hypothetical protein [Kiritimatiellales bacterium]MCF7863913.1 hypothetical protein [Kiritimatiellales bacterium]